MTEETRNMFARMLDRQDIVDFVKEIEKYQCLYDQNSFQYANKVLKRRTWLDIAKKYKSNVHDCKEKWRKIRIAYMRSLKLSKSGNPPSRPYYLADYLHFISPDRKVDDNVPTTNSPASPVSSEESLKLEIDEYDHLADSNENTDEIQQEMYEETREKREGIGRMQLDDHYSSRGINLSSSNMERLREENSRFQAEISSRRNINASLETQKREENSRFQAEISSRRNINGSLETQKSFIVDENNPRRMFLLSLLPDIEILNEQEMRTFRRQVISLLDNIIATRESVVINLSNNNKLDTRCGY